MEINRELQNFNLSLSLLFKVVLHQVWNEWQHRASCGGKTSLATSIYRESMKAVEKQIRDPDHLTRLHNLISLTVLGDELILALDRGYEL